jgi:hypothetical protein
MVALRSPVGEHHRILCLALDHNRNRHSPAEDLGIEGNRRLAGGRVAVGRKVVVDRKVAVDRKAAAAEGKMAAVGKLAAGEQRLWGCRPKH